MTDTIVTQNKLRTIEDLTLREIDMTYSLSRTGWSYAEIGRRYQISENDARTVVNNYEELRKLCESKPAEKPPNGNPKTELATTKPRKRRSDAIYATAKDRQAAYRARLKEGRAAMEKSSRAGTANEARSVDEKPSAAFCEQTKAEINPESPDPSGVTQKRPMRVTSKPANEKARDIDSGEGLRSLRQHDQCLERR